MSILSDFEDSLSKTIEGVFAGAFRSPVQPVEIAKALAKAMDDARVVGVGRVYAPVTYAVRLSNADMENFGDFSEVLGGELATYLVNHAREQSYHLASRPSVTFETDPELKLGRFRVAADLAPSEPSRAQASELATVTVGDTRHDVTLAGERMVVGRLTGCDICIEDSNVSREHAAFVVDGGDWYVEDLGSTNGTKLNGARIDRARLSDGDVVQVGVTRIVYHRYGG